MYEQYYTRQQKGDGNFPVYVGAHRQRGHGLGNILGSLFRRILPVLKSFAPHALRAGANIVDDVSKGKSWKDAAMQRVPETLSNFAFGAKDQSGSGIRRRRVTINKRAKKAKRDIFS
jgi:proline dehydrogenase